MQTAVGFAGPVELKGLHRRIEAWRQTRPGTRPMPEELWKEASGFARKLGIGSTPWDSSDVCGRVGRLVWSVGQAYAPGPSVAPISSS